MPIKRKIPYDSGHFFITFTCFNWLPLIDITNSYHLVYNWFDILKQHGHYITGYVIMPNHVHATIAFRKTTKNINKIIGDGKRFIGYEIINRLQQQDQNDILLQLQNAINSSDKKKGKQHEVWEDSFDWKECNSNNFIVQKLDYMHSNPVVGKWQLAVNAMEYPHSSAKFYICGDQGMYRVLNYLELDDINLTNEGVLLKKILLQKYGESGAKGQKPMTETHLGTFVNGRLAPEEGIDPKTGVIPGYANWWQGASIRFEPNSVPVHTPKKS